MNTPRARSLGWLPPSLLDSGPNNALTDIPGVLVGHTTLITGNPGPLVVGRGPVRTGVTAIHPHAGNLFTAPVSAAVHVLNGFGKTVGLEQIRELGRLETPILLTNTLNTWRCAEALLDWMLRTNPEIGISTGSLNPVVGECNDGWLNDIQGRHVTADSIFAALDSATTGPIPEGNVGAGTGTRCYGFKGGIGTASRILPPEKGGFTVGALLQTNFGAREQLIIRGQAVGQMLGVAGEEFEVEGGSCMLIIATDAPLSARQLGRLARRAPLGLARTGFTSNSGSGDYVITFSNHHRNTAETRVSLPIERLVNEDKILSLLFQAVVETVEEAALNSLIAAETMAGRSGHVAKAIPIDLIQTWLPPILDIKTTQSTKAH
jgi:D-aminopeptidase